MFPGTWSDADCHYAISDLLGQEAEYLWHRESLPLLGRFDCIIIPGGFSYGDYLRPGAIAKFSPIMSSIREYAGAGGLVLGICNGFQVLCETGLLPGVLMRNDHLTYRCQWAHLRVERIDPPFTEGAVAGQVLHIPISHGEGNYFADQATLQEMEERGQVLFRYCTPAGEVTPDANPNGSANNIAGITNRRGNVLGMMPHPERACESAVGGTDGTLILKSIIRAVAGE